MRNAVRATIVAIVIALATPAAAQDYDIGYEAYLNGDYAAALREWQPLADQGDAKAQRGLGQMYLEGKGVPQDETEASNLFLNAAERGHVESQLLMGAMYALGQGVPNDYVLAYMWLSLAASQGNEEATKFLDTVADELTHSQIAEAQKLAREWRPK